MTSDADVGGGDGVGGAGDALEHRHLAEEVALLEMGEDVRLAVDVLDDVHLTLLDDEHLGAELALGEDHVAGGVECSTESFTGSFPPVVLKTAFMA